LPDLSAANLRRPKCIFKAETDASEIGTITLCDYGEDKVEEEKSLSHDRKICHALGAERRTHK